jgi:hypothetical protein
MVTIVLTPDLERLLAEAARQHGTTPERLALEYLRERLLPADTVDSTEAGTMEEFLAPFIGVLDSSEHIPGGAQLSEQAGRRFTEGLLKRREQGRL